MQTLLQRTEKNHKLAHYNLFDPTPKPPMLSPPLKVDSFLRKEGEKATHVSSFRGISGSNKWVSNRAFLAARRLACLCAVSYPYPVPCFAELTVWRCFNRTLCERDMHRLLWHTNPDFCVSYELTLLGMEVVMIYIYIYIERESATPFIPTARPRHGNLRAQTD